MAKPGDMTYEALIKKIEWLGDGVAQGGDIRGMLGEIVTTYKAEEIQEKQVI